MTTSGIALEVKIYVHILAKSTGVVIPICLGVAKSLHDLIASNEHDSDPVMVKDRTLVIMTKYSILLFHFI